MKGSELEKLLEELQDARKHNKKLTAENQALREKIDWLEKKLRRATPTKLRGLELT
jgi:cell division protein FtsB